MLNILKKRALDFRWGSTQEPAPNILVHSPSMKSSKLDKKNLLKMCKIPKPLAVYLLSLKNRESAVKK